jgi:hypothetical protein
MGNISAGEFIDSCDEYTFDIVLGSDGDGAHTSNANTGTHWDCWLPYSESLSSTAPASHRTKLGKHLGQSSWQRHIRWASNAPPVVTHDAAATISCYD